MGQMANTQGTPGANPALAGAQNQQQGLAHLMQMIQANRVAHQGLPVNQSVIGPPTGGVFPVPPMTGNPPTGGVFPVPPRVGGTPSGLGALGNGVQAPIGGLPNLRGPSVGAPDFAPGQQGGLNALRAQRQARRFNRRGGIVPVGL